MTEPPARRPERRAGSALFFSTQPASRETTRIALAAVMLSATAFLATLPFASMRLPNVPAFLPAYVSALLICNLVTAAFLFGHFHFLRSRALLCLASGYVFTASIGIAQALTFPGAFSPSGLLGAGPQSAAWLYLFWQSGFPLFVVGYAVLEDGRRVTGSTARFRAALGARPGRAIAASIAAVLATVGMLTVAATSDLEALPPLIADGRYMSRRWVAFASLILPASIALAALWRQQPRTNLVVWLMVVMSAWIFDVLLAAVFSAGRYDLGWYGGRLYGLIASSSLLIVLVAENAVHFGRLAQLSAKLSVANTALEHLTLHDALTGLANRRNFDGYLSEQVALCRRHERVLALVLCDVDEFKAFNERNGHQAGDECLRRVAAALRSCCRRPADMAARYGGEEFAMILPDTDLSGAQEMAEAARAAVARFAMGPGNAGPTVMSVTISGGIAVAIGGRFNAEQLIRAADQALFEAKAGGRNRMVSAGPRAALSATA